jgi:hypothetical protein
MMQEKEAFLLELDRDTFIFRVALQAAFSEVRLAEDDRMRQALMMTRVEMYSVSKCNKARVEFSLGYSFAGMLYFLQAS